MKLTEMKPTRIQRKRVKGYKTPANTCYCGRGSKWGNPFVVGKVVEFKILNNDFASVLTLKNCLALYDRWIDIQMESGKLDLTELLKYDHLSCWCSLDSACHVDVLSNKLKNLNK